MNTIDLLNAIGNVDDILIQTAKEKQRSKIVDRRTIGAIAACTLLLIVFPLAQIIFHGAHSFNSKENAPANDQLTTNTGHASDIVLELPCTRIDITTPQAYRSIEDTDIIRSVQAEISKILSACEPLTNSAVKDEQSDNDIILGPSVSGAPAVSEKPDAGEIIISLITQPGESRAFKISSSMLIDLLDGTVYLLNDTQVSTILRIIGHTE